MNSQFFFVRPEGLKADLKLRIEKYQENLSENDLKRGNKCLGYHQENMSSNVRNRLKFAKISRKDLLCTKM